MAWFRERMTSQVAQGSFLNPGTVDRTQGSIGNSTLDIMADLDHGGARSWLWNEQGLDKRNLAGKIHYTGKSHGKNLDPGDTVYLSPVCEETDTALNPGVLGLRT